MDRFPMKYAGLTGYSNRSLFDADGNEYEFVTLTSGGIRPEGGPVVASFTLPHDAMDAYDRHYADFRRTSGFGTTYWRLTPHLSQYEDKYYVYSRLIVSKKKLYNDKDLGYVEPGSKTPITDEVFNAYTDAAYGDIAGDICNVRYEMEQVEHDAQRYIWLLANPDVLPRIVRELGGDVDKKMVSNIIDTCRSAPQLWLQPQYLKNLIRGYKHARDTADTFREQLERAKTLLPAEIPNIMAGPTK